MKIWDIIAISISNFRGNPLRTTLTILGIGVGIATIVFLVSLGYGIQELSLKRIASLEAVNTVDVSAGKAKAPDQAFATIAKDNPKVEKVVVVHSVPLQATLEDKRIDGLASIVPSAFFGLEGVRFTAGDLFAPGDQRSAVISSGLLKGFGLSEAKIIGQDVSIKLFIRAGATNTVSTVDETVKVTGTFDDDTIIAYLSDDLLAKTGELPISQVKVKAKDRNDVLGFKNSYEDAGYTVNSVAETIGQLDNIFKIVQIVLAVFGGVALVVASIGMFNTMTIALLERTRDVGVMKSIGAEDSTIYLMFLTEAILISVLGGLSGLALGWTTGKVINIAINLLAKSVGGEPANLFSTPLNFVLIMLAFSFLVGFSTGFLPARRGAKINPLDALRYE